MRFFNPGEEPVTARLKTARWLESAFRLNLNEERQAEQPFVHSSGIQSTEMPKQAALLPCWSGAGRL